MQYIGKGIALEITKDLVVAAIYDNLPAAISLLFSSTLY